MKRTTKGAMGYIACSDVALPLMPHVAEDILDAVGSAADQSLARHHDDVIGRIAARHRQSRDDDIGGVDRLDRTCGRGDSSQCKDRNGESGQDHKVK